MRLPTLSARVGGYIFESNLSIPQTLAIEVTVQQSSDNSMFQFLEQGKTAPTFFFFEHTVCFLPSLKSFSSGGALWGLWGEDLQWLCDGDSFLILGIMRLEP